VNKLHCDFCTHCKVGYNLHNSTMYILLKAKFMALINIFSLPTAFLFGRICFVVLIMRKGRESSSSGPWHLGCTMEFFMDQDPFIQPAGPSVFFVFSLGLYFVYSFVFL